MYSKKNLKAKLSFLIFIAAIGAFTMLQGFDLSGDVNGDGGNITVRLIGINNQQCIIYYIDSMGKPGSLTWTGSIGQDGLYYKYGLKPGERLTLNVCFENNGGAVQVIVKKGFGDANKPTDILNPAPNACE